MQFCDENDIDYDIEEVGSDKLITFVDTKDKLDKLYTWVLKTLHP